MLCGRASGTELLPAADVSISIYDQSRIAHTKDRGALTHDDRLDAVAGAVAHFQRAMMMDVDQAAEAMAG
jgi:hypothetical protein